MDGPGSLSIIAFRQCCRFMVIDYLTNLKFGVFDVGLQKDRASHYQYQFPVSMHFMLRFQAMTDQREGERERESRALLSI